MSSKTSQPKSQPHAYLLSSRTRNAMGQFSSSQPSVGSVRPTAPQPSQQSPRMSPAVAVASPASSATTVQRSPHVSPEKVQEAINQVRQELSASPMFSRSASASPTNVRLSPGLRPANESSRLSTSPGAPPPMPAELMSLMTNIHSMLREQQATSSLFLQRIVDIESANDKQRATVVSQSAPATDVEAVSRQNSTDATSRDEENVLQEGQNTVGDGVDDDEEKYEDIPLTASETRAIQLEQQHPEEEIMMPVDEDDALDDYVAWLRRREKLYPFEDKKLRKYYVPRHTLLSPNGRLREYSRFGFLTGWDVRLFGDLANRWFRRLLHDQGVARDGDKKPRSVSIHHVRVPQMSYDARDRLSTVRTGEENELPFNSFTLSGLPLALRGDPGLALSRAHSLSLQEEADIYINQRKRMMVAKGQLTIDGESDDSDDSSTTSSIASSEHRTCTKCDRPVYGLNTLCSVHSLKAGRHVSKVEFDAALQDRREQALRSHTSDVKAPLKQERDDVVTAARPAVQPPSVSNHVHSTVTMSSYGAPESRQESMPSLIEDEPISYPAQRLKQESAIRYNRLQKEEQERVSGLTDIDRIEESASVLGSILSRAFTPAVRATLRAGKLAVGTRLSGKDRIAAVEEMKKSGVTFSGDRMKAPAYLKRLCATVLRWDLNAGEVFQVMDSTMDKQAATWLQDTWAMTGELPSHVKPIEALLDSFMRLWMDQTTKRMFRDALKSLRMPAETATLDELNIHYAKFSEYLNGLRMCDRHVDMQDIIHEYFETLPNRVQAFIGTRYMTAISIAEVHAEAETALRTMHKRRTPLQDGDLGEVVSVHATETVPVNALPVKPRDRPRDNGSSQSAYEKQDKRDVVCFHCGDKGHYAGVECPYIDQEQTRRGQVAWADRNKTSYSPRPYDKNFYIERSKQRASASESRASNKPKSPPSNEARKKKVTFTDEKKPSPTGGRLKKVNGAPLSKKSAEPELDDEEEEADQA